MERISNKSKLIDKRYLLPFILVTSLFALWGFANDITRINGSKYRLSINLLLLLILSMSIIYFS